MVRHARATQWVLLAPAPATLHNLTMPNIRKNRGRTLDASSKSGQIRGLLKTGMKPMDIAKKLSCTPALVYNVKARVAGGPAKRGPGRPPNAKSGRASGLD